MALRFSICAFCVLAAVTYAPAATIAPGADPGPTSDDPVNYDKITITDNSPTIGGSDIRDIFGGDFSTLEGSGHTLFADTQPGAQYHVTFTPNSDIIVGGFNLWLNEDAPNFIHRSATDFEVDVAGATADTIHIVDAGQNYFSK